MKKEEIVDSIVKNLRYKYLGKECKYRKDDVMEVINYFLETIKMSLRVGDRVTIRDFGAFVVRHKKSRPSINVHTGERIMTKERDHVTFIQSKTFDVNSLF